jgi:hypothetical protein
VSNLCRVTNGTFWARITDIQAARRFTVPKLNKTAFECESRYPGRMWFKAFAVGVFAALAPSIAFADPCEGELPRQAGATFSGIVRYVGDGDSLCVGNNRDPSTWIEVRLADFNAPELNADGGRAAKTLLERIAFGRVARCTTGGGRSGRVTSYDRVIATCRVDGRRIGDLLRDAGAEEGGR